MVRNDKTSYKETKFGILPRNKIIKLEVDGTKKGLVLLRKISPKKLTSELIKEVHGYCFSEILLKEAGVFRKVQVIYSGKEAPHFSKLHEMVRNLCEDTQYMIKHLPKKESEKFILQVVELLAKFQHRFVFIHPFVDYNGRMARMFTNYILMGLELPIIEIKAEKFGDRKKYINALQKADEGDYGSLENIIGSALDESLKKATTD